MGHVHHAGQRGFARPGLADKQQGTVQRARAVVATVEFDRQQAEAAHPHFPGAPTQLGLAPQPLLQQGVTRPADSVAQERLVTQPCEAAFFMSNKLGGNTAGEQISPRGFHSREHGFQITLVLLAQVQGPTQVGKLQRGQWRPRLAVAAFQNKRLTAQLITQFGTRHVLQRRFKQRHVRCVDDRNQ